MILKYMKINKKGANAPCVLICDIIDGETMKINEANEITQQRYRNVLRKIVPCDNTHFKNTVYYCLMEITQQRSFSVLRKNILIRRHTFQKHLYLWRSRLFFFYEITYIVYVMRYTKENMWRKLIFERIMASWKMEFITYWYKIYFYYQENLPIRFKEIIFFLRCLALGQ